ncbi:MAG: hypothetical protein ACREDR_12825 [Blastocatellia bacterium]
MDAQVTAYAIYLIISIGLTVWVAQTLFKNGRIFLVDVFHGNEPLADSVNHLLVVGFYLMNLGFVCLALQSGAVVHDAREAFEALSTKIGFVLLVLGGMHFMNLFIFSRMRRRATIRNMPPPVLPDEYTFVRGQGTCAS